MTTGFSELSSFCYQLYSQHLYTESILNNSTLNYAVMPGFSFSFRRPLIPENIKPIFLYYQFYQTISIEQDYTKCLPVLHEQNSQHTPRAAIRTSTAGSQRSGHFSSLINPHAFQVSYLQQEWWYSPSSAHSVILSKNREQKNVFLFENVRYGKNDTIFFFLILFRWLSVLH